MSDSRDGRHRRGADDGVPFVIPPWAQETFMIGERHHLRLWTPEPPSPDRGRSRWHWLLVPPAVAPLLIPFYNRIEPRLFGLPFFYWCQLTFIPLSMVIITIVCFATRRQD